MNGNDTYETVQINGYAAHMIITIPIRCKGSKLWCSRMPSSEQTAGHDAGPTCVQDCP